MKLLRIGLHGLMLALADLAGILGGFMVFKTLDFEQMLTQPPVAATISILLFVVWSFLLRALGGQRLLLLDLKELLWVFLASLAVALAVFVPLHFFTQGYLTNIMNVVFLVLFQLPVNLIALCGIWILQN
jgi:hypothetical protein